MVFKENSHRNMEKTLHLFLMKFFVPYRWYNLFLVCEQEDFFLCSCRAAFSRSRFL